MYVMQAEDATVASAFPALNEQLERDVSGELRDRLTTELREAVRSIDAALAAGPPETAARVLRPLREAAQVAERVLSEVWHSLHG